jgi:hypothetical protein
MTSQMDRAERESEDEGSAPGLKWCGFRPGQQPENPAPRHDIDVHHYLVHDRYPFLYVAVTSRSEVDTRKVLCTLCGGPTGKWLTMGGSTANLGSSVRFDIRQIWTSNVPDDRTIETIGTSGRSKRAEYLKGITKPRIGQKIVPHLSVAPLKTRD